MTEELSSTTRPEGGRSIDAGRPVEWLKEGWQLFLLNPAIWIGMTVILVVICVALNMIPMVGQLALNLLTPVLGGGLLIGCRSLRNGGELRFDHLLAGFKTNTGSLIMIGVFYLIGMAAIFLVALLVSGGSALTGAFTGHGAGAGMALGGLLLALLIILALSVPLIMAVWFAPALVVFQNAEPIPAMKASFAGCLKNMLPFLVYSILILVAALLASLPLMLGWLVLLPVLIGAHYFSYLDIFE